MDDSTTSEPATLDPTSLRERHYNATLTEIVEVHDDLRLLRVLPDGLSAMASPYFPDYEAGQYVTLGLGLWEPRVPGAMAEEEHAPDRIAKRAYSVSCPLLREGRLVRVTDCPFLEFFVVLVRQAPRPPVLTPRLFALQPGDRLQIGTRFVGDYTLAGVAPGDDVLLVSTGSGEAPHNALVAELLHRGHAGRIFAVSGMRWRRDLAYLAAHRENERHFPNYRYLPLTTREPENLDPTAPHYVGKLYVQQFVESGQLEREANWRLDPARTHVYLCGNAGMIGYHPHASEHDGMLRVLLKRGFRIDEPPGPGTVRFEKFF